MMLSLFYCAFFFYVKLRDKTGASALSRGFGTMWLFIISWLMLVIATLGFHELGIASGYAAIFFCASAFVAYLVSLLELFSLDRKHKVAERIHEDNAIRDHLEHVPDASHAEAIAIRTGSGNYDGSHLIAPSPGELDVGSVHSAHDDRNEHDVTETSPLLRRSSMPSTISESPPRRRSFVRFRRPGRPVNGNDDDSDSTASTRSEPKPYGDEQAWSGPLWTWTWILQFLVLAPVSVVLLGQVALLASTAISQTGVDGSSLRLPYLVIAAFTILLMLPLAPFVHRVHGIVPIALFFVFALSLTYCLLAFPFSAEARFKVFWQQTIDCDTGNNTVRLLGLEKYTRQVIADLPSATGKTVVCGPAPSTVRSGLTLCEYDGAAVPPRLDPSLPPGIPPETAYSDLVTYSVTNYDPSSNAATLTIDAVNSKACALRFEQPVTNFSVQGASSWDGRFGAWPEAGVGQIRLWRRHWTGPWVVNLSWEGRETASDDRVTIEGGGEEAVGELKERALATAKLPLNGRVVCLWADANTPGTIPAFDEAVKYAPQWAAITKMSDGLVEASKAFIL